MGGRDVTHGPSRGALLVAVLLGVPGCGVASGAVTGAGPALPATPDLQVAFGGQFQRLVGAPVGEASWLRREDGSHVAMVASDRPGQRHLYWSSSTDGRTWAPFRPATAGALTDVEPVLFASAQGLECVFSSNRWLAQYALYRTSLREGRWSEPVRLELGPGPHRAPAVARFGDKWVLAWQGPEGVTVSTSGDGLTFPRGKMVLAQHGDPAVAAVGERLLVLGHQRKALTATVLDQGGWSSPVRVPLAGPAWSPALTQGASDSLALAYATAAGDLAPAAIGLARWSAGRWADLGRAASSPSELEAPAWCGGAAAPLSLLLGMDRMTSQQALVRLEWKALPGEATTTLPTLPAGGPDSP